MKLGRPRPQQNNWWSGLTFRFVFDIQHFLHEKLDLRHVGGVDVSVDDLVHDTVHADLQKTGPDEMMRVSQVTNNKNIGKQLPTHQETSLSLDQFTFKFSISLAADRSTYDAILYVSTRPWCYPVIVHRILTLLDVCGASLAAGSC